MKWILILLAATLLTTAAILLWHRFHRRNLKRRAEYRARFFEIANELTSDPSVSAEDLKSLELYSSMMLNKTVIIRLLRELNDPALMTSAPKEWRPNLSKTAAENWRNMFGYMLMIMGTVSPVLGWIFSANVGRIMAPEKEPLAERTVLRVASSRRRDESCAVPNAA